MKHTPGPWSVLDHTKQAPFQEMLCIPEVDFAIECNVFAHINDTDRANARLIAAAPDMLAALELVEKWWLEQGMEHFDGAPAAIFATRTAIKKARGQ